MSKTQQLFITTERGVRVVVSKKAIRHLVAHEADKDFVFKAVQRVELAGTFLKQEVQFHAVIGTTKCVPTTEEDEIVWARRIKRPGQTRFVKGKEPVPCSVVTVILKKIVNEWHLVTGYIGHAAPKELTDPTMQEHELEEATKFWNTHALIWDESIVQRKP